MPKRCAPRPAGAGGEAACLLRAVDVIPCRCPLEAMCLAGHPGYPKRCSVGVKRCATCPPNLNLLTHACAHTRHPLTACAPGVADWALLARAADPEGFADRPPPEPACVPHRAARLALSQLRAAAGHAAFAPPPAGAPPGGRWGDGTAAELDRLDGPTGGPGRREKDEEEAP